ncbi:hypothetical protein J3F84DRAFT_408366 [Trichoderma pleuroticola]
MANYDDDEISEAGSVPSLDNLQYDEILDLDPEDIDRHPFEEKSEEAQFREQTWEQQWKEVVRSLQGQGRLLEEYKKKALTSRDARERTTPTFLHILAKRRDTDDFGNLPGDTLSKIIKYLLEYQDSALVESGLSKPKDDPILRVAMEFNNTKFIESVTECSSEIPGKLDELLNATDHDGMNCLHYAFKEQLPKALGTHQGIKQSSAIAPERPNLRTTIKTIHGFVKEAKPETIAARDNYGNTPVHYAMDYNNCRLQVKQYSNIVQYLVLTGDKILKRNPDQQFNLNNESPYLYYLRTREKWLKQNRRTGVATASATTSLERGGNRTGREGKPPIRTGALYESRKDNTKDDYSTGEYQKKLLPPKPGTTEPSRTKMGPPPPPDKDKNLYFDASHLAGKTVDQVVDLIEKLSKAGGFEDTLSYVNLPILTTIHEKSSASKSDNRGYSSNEKRQRGGAHQENPKLGRSALISVFDKLVSVNIRHILRLQVDDREGLPHTDAAIERAIRGQDSFGLGNTRKEEIKIESWDWRKPDLSMDVISFAAPDATHINLYWSGNQTILKGWGYPEGIARDATSNGKLRRVTLHAFPGFESRDRMLKMIETFETEINDRTKGRVKIEKRIHSGTVTSSIKSDDDLDPSDIGASDGPPQQVWVERMEDFRSSLISVHRLLGGKIKIPPVALIDDGVDLLSFDTYNIAQATGLSYCPPDGKTERPWHQSTNGHGTVMANMIVRINPWVSLDVMKIHESTSHSPGSKTRTIYAESAARAIEGAIIRKADIISMSWTIRKLAKKIGSVPNALDIGTDEEHKRSPEEVAMDALQKAIEKAKSRNILMFCSAADDIQLLGRESLPFSAASDCILRIGAALPKGQRDPTSEDFNTISYFFPGNQVAEARNPRSSKPVEYHDGSSVSTALAAGLASLIIYCTNVVKTYYDDSRPFTDWALKLRNHKNMRTAFDNINSPDYDDKKFLPVWKTFGDATERINNAQGEKKKIVELENLVRILCHKLEAE